MDNPGDFQVGEPAVSEEENNERILARTLATELPSEQLEEVAGGLLPPTATCNCSDCTCDI